MGFNCNQYTFIVFITVFIKRSPQTPWNFLVYAICHYLSIIKMNVQPEALSLVISAYTSWCFSPMLTFMHWIIWMYPHLSLVLQLLSHIDCYNDFEQSSIVNLSPKLNNEVFKFCWSLILELQVVEKGEVSGAFI